MSRRYVHLNNTEDRRSEPSIHQFLKSVFAKDRCEVVMRGDHMERITEDRAVNASTTLDHAGGEARVEPTRPADAGESIAAPLPAHAALRQHLLAPAPQYNDWDEV